MHHNRRRKKQRANYGKRTVDVRRSVNGFGFTISGQQPCILSCIVPKSPADLAGLRAGDLLRSVNGLNVSKLPHEVVVQLINDSVGTIRLAIAENYYSDSSDDDSNVWQNGIGGSGAGSGSNTGIHDIPHRMRRPKYPHHKMKMHRGNTQQQQQQLQPQLNPKNEIVNEVIDGNDVAAMADMESIALHVNAKIGPSMHDTDERFQQQLEYRTVVGYLGTIEMPSQIATSSKQQTVRSCIRKMRQEKRQPSVVLLQILPNCLKLYNSENALIAKYPAGRLSYVSTAAATSSGIGEVDMRFFGLVTSAAYADGQICDLAAANRADVVVSNSCHVFVIDLKLIDHISHFKYAELYSIVCTKDPITNCCLEFPSGSDYVVNLIRRMYALNATTFADQALNANGARSTAASNRANKPRLPEAANNARQQPNHHRDGNSPQPSNHSEITTASSNSDSGIGFHNDFTNISDRIVVVDFPHQVRPLAANVRHANAVRMNLRPIPFGADSIRNIRSTVSHSSVIVPDVNSVAMPMHAKSKSLDSTTPMPPKSRRSEPPDLRLIRAMPDPLPMVHYPIDVAISETSPVKYETIYGDELPPRSERDIDATSRILPKSTNYVTNLADSNFTAPIPSISTARSCDNIMMITRSKKKLRDLQASFDDVSLLGEAPPPPTSQTNDETDDDYVFLAPQAPPTKRHTKKSKKPPKSVKAVTDRTSTEDLLSYKLSPKVFGVAKPIASAISQKLSSSKRRLSMGNESTKENSDTNNMCNIKNREFNVWGSLQDLEMLNKLGDTRRCSISDDGSHSRRDFTLEAACSEPDLTVSAFDFVNLQSLYVHQEWYGCRAYTFCIPNLNFTAKSNHK